MAGLSLRGNGMLNASSSSPANNVAPLSQATWGGTTPTQQGSGPGWGFWSAFGIQIFAIAAIVGIYYTSPRRG